jgi:hypothetical protein
MPTVSFQIDIVPIFAQYRGSMLWRLDLTNYEDVKANAEMLYSQIIKGGGMPPAPYESIPADQVALFKKWMAQGFHP